MWKFQHRQQGHEIRTELELYWEVLGDPISDDYTREEADARQLWRLWLNRSGRGEYDPKLGPGWVPIYWSVQSSGGDPGILEYAPYSYAAQRPDRDFLTQFTWPRDDRTGEDVKWPALPVCDKFWNAERADKGGFFQEATGWKPGAYQPLVHIPSLARAAGLPF